MNFVMIFYVLKKSSKAAFILLFASKKNVQTNYVTNNSLAQFAKIKFKTAVRPNLF